MSSKCPKSTYIAQNSHVLPRTPLPFSSPLRQLRLIFVFLLHLGLADVLELLSLGLFGNRTVHRGDVHLYFGALYPLLTAGTSTSSVLTLFGSTTIVLHRYSKQTPSTFSIADIPHQPRTENYLTLDDYLMSQSFKTASIVIPKRLHGTFPALLYHPDNRTF